MSTYEEAIEKEVADWPGASVTFEHRGKHRAAVIAFEGQTRFVIFPKSPSDVKGQRNCISAVRAELNRLGAERAVRRASSLKRERNHGVRRDMNIERAPVIPDPWAPLRRVGQ